MSRMTKLAAIAAASAATIALTATPALAWTDDTLSAAANANSLVVKPGGSTVATCSEPPATVTFTDQPVTGSGFFCASNVTVSATYVFTQP